MRLYTVVARENANSEASFRGQRASLFTAGLAPGLYLLTVQAEGQAPLTRRVVVE